MIERLMNRYYPMTAQGWRFRNATAPFYQDWLMATVPPSAKVLNVGAGPTPDSARLLRGRFAQLVGVDPDPVVLNNSDLDEAHVNDGIRLPFSDATFDAAFSDWTLEHVDYPTAFLAEVERVLKPGASFFSRTPNRRHYMTAISSHTPHWFHRLVANRARGLPADTHEPWPTRYRMNTPGAIRAVARQVGFCSVEVRLLEPEPMYLRFNPGAFVLGIAYERLVNRLNCLSPLRLVMLVRMTKPRHRCHPGDGALGQGERGTQLQARLRVPPHAVLPR